MDIKEIKGRYRSIMNTANYLSETIEELESRKNSFHELAKREVHRMSQLFYIGLYQELQKLVDDSEICEDSTHKDMHFTLTYQDKDYDFTMETNPVLHYENSRVVYNIKRGIHLKRGYLMENYNQKESAERIFEKIKEFKG